jgi:hypothetical protein
MRNDATLVVADTIEMQHLSRLPFSRRAMKGFVDNVTLLQEISSSQKARQKAQKSTPGTGQRMC